ncbi:MAG: hypothetical protein JNG90_07040 [Planctomycetaceae bacterium]|nr:hypothetical protein [Planctomycetaceae bacterium]
MLLSIDEAHLFFKLHRALMFFVNDRRRVLPDKLSSPKEFGDQSPAARLKVRNALVDDVDLIESFVDQNPFDFSEEELDLVLSWRHLVAGSFYIYRELKSYTVFLDAGEQPIAYGVVALTQPFEEMIGPYLPVLTETVLLPFREKIIYDGMLAGPGVSLSFGAGIRRMLKESYDRAKDRYGIVTSLPVSELPASAKKPQRASNRNPKRRQTHDVQDVLRVITGLIDEFCRNHLNDEYAVLCRKLAEKLARKRPSPLLSGKPNTWACGIVRTIGMLNFLSDRSKEPSMKMSDVDKAFGVGESTASGKSAEIRKMLKLHRFDHEWMLPSRVDDNPLVWLLNVNGFMMDIRDAPREAQAVAFERGLIPYIPADRDEAN